MTKLNDIEFECLFCKKKHKVKDWINGCLDKGLAVFDSNRAEEAYRTEGRILLHYAGLHCDCGKDYSAELTDGTLTLYYDGEQVGKTEVWGDE